MENRKGSGIFLGVIGVATLIVAIIGATFAFFSANAASEAEAISATGATLQLGFAEDNTGLNHNLIPAEDYIATFAATDETHIGENRANECIDDNGNEVCGVYIFTIGNPSFTTQQGLYGNIKVANNGFANLYFQIYDETGAAVFQDDNGNEVAQKFTDADKDGLIQLPELEQQLLTTDETAATAAADFDATDPTTYPARCVYDGTTCTETNVRTYKLVIWIHETGSNQTEVDSGMTFAAGINFTSANDKTGVTGVISAAKDPNAEEEEAGA